jgi:hypothetical protein
LKAGPALDTFPPLEGKVLQINWALFALVAFGLMGLVWVAVLLRSARSLESVYISFGFLVLAGINAAAPARALLDPSWSAYSLGMLRAEPGWPTSALAAGVVALAFTGMVIVAANRPGPAMWLAAAASLFFLAALGWSWVDSLVRDPSANRLALGEYLVIPGPCAAILIGVAWIVPFAIGAPWCVKNAIHWRQEATHSN